jgi:phage-related protein
MNITTLRAHDIGFGFALVREPVDDYTNSRIVSMAKRLRFVGSARHDLAAFPKAARARAGFELFAVQAGRDPTDWKPMTSVGPGACEIRVRDATGVYRVIYVARFHDAVYVLHAFQKKSRKTAQPDLEIARDRFRIARGLSEGAMRGEDRD